MIEDIALNEPAGTCEVCGTVLTVGSAKVQEVTLSSGRVIAMTLCDTCMTR